MTRLHEREIDRDNQDCCQWALEYHGYEVRQTSTTNGVDMRISVRGVPYALAEFKEREKIYRNRGTVVIDVDKVDGVIRRASKFAVKPWVIVRWKSVGGYWVWDCHTNLRIQKKFKRKKPRYYAGEPLDAPDDVYHVPLDQFYLLPDAPSVFG